MRSNQSKGGVNSPFFDFLEKYWLIIVSAIFMTPTIMKWIKDINVEGEKDDIKNTKEVNDAENVVQNPKLIKDKIDKYLIDELKIGKEQREKLMADTQKLVHHLGTRAGSSWWEVSYWTEDDDEIEEILKRQVYNFKILERLYFLSYTESRNLSNDILKYLDKSNLTSVRAFWSQHNKSYL